MNFSTVYYFSDYALENLLKMLNAVQVKGIIVACGIFEVEKPNSK
jgi:hypothetical protein